MVSLPQGVEHPDQRNADSGRKAEVLKSTIARVHDVNKDKKEAPAGRNAEASGFCSSLGGRGPGLRAVAQFGKRILNSNTRSED
jgi:hypothetical protein